jgi:hypothetical protein
MLATMDARQDGDPLRRMQDRSVGLWLHTGNNQ